MIQKKKSTWHKNKTVPHKTRTEKQESKKIANAKHWVVSQAKLVKIMESAGITPENNIKMLPRNRDR